MKFLKDIFLNILSQALFLAVQQIILFPIFESHLGQKEFGFFLLLYGIFNVFTVTIATSFTNLYQKKLNIYIDQSREVKTYYIFYKKMIVYCLLILLMVFVVLFFTKFNTLSYLLISILVILTTSRMFLIVWYRVHKNYIFILFINLILSLMYVLVLVINPLTISEILLSFIVIELLVNIIIYILLKININRFFEYNMNDFSYASLNFLMLSGFSASLMNYSDRFLINILLGASSVTVFYIATLPTKLMILPFNMMSTVILSYLAKSNNINKQIKRKLLLLLPIIFIIVSSLSYLIGLLIIKLLYDEYYDNIQSIYFIVVFTFGLVCVDSIVRSFILKYYSIIKKSVLDISILLIFIVLSIFLVLINHSLLSIALAQLVSMFLKVIIEIFILLKLEVED
ncbi:hypothetical protein [Staphylococcus hsinchuensis]|uniref:Capsular biosynthesis protein n=2 Tax=Staphylococcus TaxID=1279 RepID=A0ABZ3EFX7_9STAP